MGLFDWFRSAPNRTSEWRTDDRVLEFDLEDHRLGDVRLKDRFDRLEFLGPGRPIGVEFSFPDHGLLVEVDDRDRIAGFSIFFGHPDEPNEGCWTHGLKVGGESWSVDKSTREADWIERFAAPYWRNAEDDEVILFYEWGPGAEPDVEWQVEFGTDGGLSCLVVGAPLLADEEQRRMYEVTKPWPPR